MNNSLIIYYILLIFSISYIYCQQCLNSDSHKPAPSQEDKLHNKCAPWSKLSCCNESSSLEFHSIVEPFLNFDYNHCGKISDKCRNRFIQDLCLYQCDPYLAPWIVSDRSRNFRDERYFNIPLCKRDCDAWFEDCKDDFTCRDNWKKGFDWSSGINKCRSGDECIKFEKMFGTAEKFCNQIWDGSFKVTNDSICVTFEFDENYNPNIKALKYYSPLNSNNFNLLKFSTEFILLCLSLSLINFIF